MSTIRVLAAVLRRDGRVLIARRPLHKRHGGLWEFPGGKVEAGESDREAMARELREELGLELVAMGAERHVRLDPGSPFEIVFIEVDAAGEPEPLEHDALAWVGPAEVGAYDLAPADREAASVLLASADRAASLD